MWIELPIVVRADNKRENGKNIRQGSKLDQYLINADNINYCRSWEVNGEPVQTALFFNATDKYILVNLPLNEVKALLKEK